MIAATGWDTFDLIAAIVAADLEGPFDVVTLLIGVNNQFRGGALTEFEAGLASLTNTAIGFADGDAGRVPLISIPDWGVTAFAAAAPRAEIAGRLAARLEGIADGVSLTHNRFPDPDHWADIVADLKAR